MEKIICKRGPEGPEVYGVNHELVHHSPTGFEWGYGGSGPAELALNILYKITGNEDVAFRHHQDFKWEFISTMPFEGGEIDVAEVRDWLRKRGWKG